jgi:hypothetical protein
LHHSTNTEVLGFEFIEVTVVQKPLDHRGRPGGGC